MATLGQASDPVRFGQGQTANDRQLWLDVFGGEVLTFFDLATVTMGRHRVKTVGGGAKSWRFPKTGQAEAFYHQPGQEMLGENIPTGEITITIDDILVSPKGISDIDEMLAHFDVRGPFAQEMAQALARKFDKNAFRQIITAARTGPDGPFPGGNIITDSALAPTSGVVDGNAWIEAIKQANIDLFNKNVPDETPRFMTVDAETFSAIRYAKDSNGNYLVLDQDFGQQAGVAVPGRPQSMQIDGVEIIRSRNMPKTDEVTSPAPAGTTGYVYPKYRADYSNTLGVLWCPDAIATVRMMDVGVESSRDTRRLEDFMVAKALVGHGTLRPELAVEFAVPAV